MADNTLPNLWMEDKTT